MHVCKSCKKEIEAEATKCPYCQGYQVWYKNPQHLSYIFVLPVFVFIFWNAGRFGDKHFEAYQDEFSAVEENTVVLPKTQARLITYRVKNNTDYKWDRISYEVIASDNGELIAVSTGVEYAWVIQPKSESLLTVKVQAIPDATAWELKIKNINSAFY